MQGKGRKAAYNLSCPPILPINPLPPCPHTLAAPFPLPFLPPPVQSLLRTPPAPPGDTHVLFEHFWLEHGPLPPADDTTETADGRRHFVATPSVRRHLANLARAVLLRRHPILLQGPTSSGKTSLVAHLAAATGHTCVRINNHEHTDLQVGGRKRERVAWSRE